MELTGDDIRRVRVKSGVSQTKLAEKLKVDRKTIRNWEEGFSEPTTNQFIKICTICSINKLILFTRLSIRVSSETPIDMDGIINENK